MKKLFCFIAFGLMFASNLQADLVVTNGDFSNGLTGWTTSGTVNVVSGAAVLSASAGLHQDFSAGTTGTAENFNFQLDFTFTRDALNQNQRIRIRDNSNAGDIVTFRFDNGTGVQAFDGQAGTGTGFQNALSFTMSANTNYHFRLIGSNFNSATRSYTVGLSSNGVDYTTSGPLSIFHSAAFGSDFETLRLESGTGTVFTVDSITAVPEPGALTMVGLVAAVGFVRRRRS
ncbi:MAG: PEP-CTERM sorting domain-containing protein [Planctomycetaceae bacterium]|nr:PEP-CTERM sorting domain-containing protein [Planctomycetaceae bacterium]